MGAIVDFPRLYPNLTATEFLRICSSQGISGRHEIERVLRFVELGDSASRQIEKYSLGMKQRLALASAILGNPGILILDEPLNGLDVRRRRDVSLLARLRSLRKTRSSWRCTSLNTCDPSPIRSRVISKSKLVYSGPPPSLGSCCVFDIGDSTAFIALLVEVVMGEASRT
ncbi:MAG: ATP-binding cassette domain-containing protein [Lysobacterales bacterium]